MEGESTCGATRQGLDRLKDLAPENLADTTLDAPAAFGDLSDPQIDGEALIQDSPFSFTPLHLAAVDWNMWAEIAAEEEPPVPPEDCGSHPAGAIKLVYASTQRLPFWSDGGGNNIGVDYDPGPAGRVGQVISFGSDDCHNMAVLGESVTDFLHNVRRLLESGAQVHHLVDGMRTQMYGALE